MRPGKLPAATLKLMSEPMVGSGLRSPVLVTSAVSLHHPCWLCLVPQTRIVLLGLAVEPPCSSLHWGGCEVCCFYFLFVFFVFLGKDQMQKQFKKGGKAPFLLQTCTPWITCHYTQLFRSPLKTSKLVVKLEGNG